MFWVGFCSAQDIGYAKKIVKTLTSEEFHGRGYVNEGSEKTAKFISQQFSDLQLKTVSQQTFFVSVNTFPGQMFVKINDSILKPGIDYLIDPASSSISLSGIPRLITPEHLKNDTAFFNLISSLKKEIIVIDLQKGNLQPIQDKLNYLKYSRELNHQAVIIIDDRKLTWGLSQVQAVRPVITVKNAPNITTTDTVTLHIDARLYKEYPVRNVAGKVEGLKRDSLILFTAHYDHLGRMGDDTYFPGANDNASGIAMLLNLAQYFSENPTRYDVLFIAFAAEELGLLGSQYFVKNPPVDLSRIKFLVNFDLAGTGDEGIKVVNATKYRAAFTKLHSFNTKMNLLPAVEKRGEACISDHCPFDRHHVPCFYIYTLGGIQAYHDIYDRYETLPLTEFMDYTTLMIRFIESL
jgi:hypothetical protein